MPVTSLFYTSDLHPNALYLSADIWQQQQGSGILARELEHIDLTDIHCLRTVLPDNMCPPSNWAQLRKTLMRTVPVQGALSSLRQAEIGNYDFRLVTKGDHEWPEWINFHWDKYLENHQDNPPARLSYAEKERLFGSADLDPENAVGIWQSGALVAFSGIRSVTRTTAEVGWCGSKGNDAARMLRAVIFWVFSKAADLSMESVELEADDNDSPLWEIVKQLPSIRDENYTTWESVVPRRQT